VLGQIRIARLVALVALEAFLLGDGVLGSSAAMSCCHDARVDPLRVRDRLAARVSPFGSATAVSAARRSAARWRLACISARKALNDLLAQTKAA